MRHARSGGCLAGLAVILWLLIGCRGAAPWPERPTAPPTPTPDPDWVVYTRPEDGFSIALPVWWKQIDMHPEALEAEIQSLEQLNPSAGPQIGAQARSLATQSVAFLGADISPAACELAKQTGTAAIVLVMSASLQSGPSLDSIAEQTVQGLEESPVVVQPVSHRHVALADAEAEQLSYQIEGVLEAGRTFRLAVIDYYIASGKRLYRLGLTAPAEAQGSYGPVFEKIAASFRLIK